MGDSERAFRKMCFFNVYFTALFEECDITGQMKDIRLPMVNVLLISAVKMVDSCSNENGVLSRVLDIQ